MAVNLKSDKDAIQAAATAATTEAEKPEQLINLELRRCSRYFYGNQLYVKGEAYSFSSEDARHMMSLRDPGGLPTFRVSHNEPGVRTYARTQPAQVAEEEQDAQPPKAPVPVASKVIDLSDDDADITAKLKSADSDTADAVPL